MLRSDFSYLIRMVTRSPPSKRVGRDLLLTTAEAQWLRACGFPTAHVGWWRIPALPDPIERICRLPVASSTMEASEGPGEGVEDGGGRTGVARSREHSEAQASTDLPVPAVNLSILSRDARRVLQSLVRHGARPLSKRSLQQRLHRLPASRLNGALQALVEQGLVRWEAGDVTITRPMEPVVPKPPEPRKTVIVRPAKRPPIRLATSPSGPPETGRADGAAGDAGWRPAGRVSLSDAYARFQPIGRAERLASNRLAMRSPRRHRKLTQKLVHAGDALTSLLRYSKSIDPHIGQPFERAALDCLERIEPLLGRSDRKGPISIDWKTVRSRLLESQTVLPVPDDPTRDAMVSLYWFFRHGCKQTGDESEVRTGLVRNTFWTRWVRAVVVRQQYETGESGGCEAVHIAVFRSGHRTGSSR